MKCDLEILVWAHPAFVKDLCVGAGVGVCHVFVIYLTAFRSLHVHIPDMLGH